MRPKTYPVPAMVYLPQGVKERVQEEAIKEGLLASAWMRRAILNELRRTKGSMQMQLQEVEQ